MKLGLSCIMALFAIAMPVWGQSADTPSAREIAELKEQIERLSNQLNSLEARYAASQDLQLERESMAEAEKATSPKVTLDGGGLRVRSVEGAFEHRVRLRLAHDFAWFSQDRSLKRALGEELDGTDFRAARIQLQGKLWEDFTYTGEFDFVGQTGADSPKFRDVFLQYNAIPFFGENTLSFRAGHFREPFSLDELNPIVTRQFMETPLLNVFAPSRNAGVQLSGAFFGEPSARRMTMAVGFFRETDDWPSSNDSDDRGWQVTGRVTGLPYYADEGRRLLHAGAAFSHRDPDGARLRYGLRPESRLALFRYADTDNLPVGFRLRDARADNVNLYGLELAGVFEGFSFQSEYIRSAVDTVLGGNLNFDGYYFQAGYLFTGEHRPYRHASATFGAPKPLRPFSWRGEKRGWGAWELVARYGAVDLNAGPVRGGEHRSLTFGLNWYLNENVRLFANYTRNDIEHDLYKGSFDMFATRIQLEF